MSRELGAVIVGTGSALPERVLTNHDLEKMVDTSDEWIFTRTGIRERRIADDGVATSDLAVEASRKALDMAGVGPEDVDLVITATITPDYIFPATSCVIGDKLGCAKAGGFDLEAACSGFVYGLAMADGYLMTHPDHTVLVVGAELLSRITNWSDRTSCILFGDAAGAAVLQKGPPDRGIMSCELGMDGSGAEMMIIPAGGSRRPTSEETLRNSEQFMIIRGREVFKFAVSKMGECVRNAMRRHDLAPEDVAMIVPHQVNVRILQSAAERNKVPMDKIMMNIERYGNTSAASVPVALDEANRKGLLKEGDIVIQLGFGGGLTWACSVSRW